MREYPNMMLIEYKFRDICRMFAKDNPEKIRDKDWEKHHGIEMEVFLQVFPDTATIFENGGMSGQAFTKEYITVCHETCNDLWGVFGTNSLAYFVYEADEEFYEDLRNRSMKTKKDALSAY